MEKDVWVNFFLDVSMLLAMGAIAVCFVVLLEIFVRRQKPRGVFVFGILLITGSLYKLWGLRDYDYYRFMFQQLPENVMFVRYLVSVTLRFVGVAVAVGVLLRQEWYRKILLVLCAFTVAFVWLKHPLFVFENISRHTEQQLLNRPPGAELMYPLHPWISMIAHGLIDIIFSGSALYYFSRKDIKSWFH